MSFINKSSKKIAPKKPQNRGTSGIHIPTPSSTEHTASPAPPAAPSATATATTQPSESRQSSVQPSTNISTKPLPNQEPATREDSTPSTLPDTNSTRRSISPTATRTPQNDTTPHPPSPQLPRAKPSPRRAGGIPISMPGATRIVPTPRQRSPQAHRIQPARRDVSTERQNTEQDAQIPSIAVTHNAPLAPSPNLPSQSSALRPTEEQAATTDPSSLPAPDTAPSPGPSTAKPSAKQRKRRRAAATDPTDEPPDAQSDGQQPQKKKRGRKPKVAPQNAENLEIEPTVVRMTDLCRDTFIGKKSKLYEEIEKIDWLDVVKKQRARKAELEARKAAGEDVAIETVEQRLERLSRENAAARGNSGKSGGGAGGMAPQMRIVNGQLILDETSLQVDRRERDVGADGPLEIIEESNLTRRVNSATWSKREKTERWDDDETERFYEALSMFGTDFEMMSKMFVGRSRRMLKNKFVVEERRNPRMITAALKKKIPVNMAEYSRLASREFGDVATVEDELRKIREEHEQGLAAAAAESSALTKERNEAALAELEKEANGEAGADGDKGDKVAGKRQKKGKQKFVSRQGGDDEAVVVGSVDDFQFVRR
ncbi:Transcription factor TFIIIB component B [Orbilia brochopaga]|uniref:Transcription factor TFIIIB component B n=1 Tax=Orbilia brochopaga TaxID=3140254 RepID=A0AAV9UVV1_9PEZI